MLTIRPEGDIPPASPEVLVDASLVSSPEDIAFDFEAFYELSRTVGLSDEHITSYTIHYADGELPYIGKYHPRKRMTEIAIRSCIDDVYLPAIEMGEDFQAVVEQTYGAKAYQRSDLASIINEATIHETGHFVHHAIGNWRFARQLDYLPLYAYAIGGSLLPASCYEELVGNGSIEIAVLALSGLLLTGAGGLITYARSKRPPAGNIMERPAYAFQEQYSDRQVVALVVRDELMSNLYSPGKD